MSRTDARDLELRLGIARRQARERGSAATGCLPVLDQIEELAAQGGAGAPGLVRLCLATYRTELEVFRDCVDAGVRWEDPMIDPPELLLARRIHTAAEAALRLMGAAAVEALIQAFETARSPADQYRLLLILLFWRSDSAVQAFVAGFSREAADLLVEADWQLLVEVLRRPGDPADLREYKEAFWSTVMAWARSTPSLP